MVRAKFYVESKTQSKGSKDGGSVILFPVTSGSEENKNFFMWTPGGKFELSTINKSAFDALEVGAEYYIDISPAAQ